MNDLKIAFQNTMAQQLALYDAAVEHHTFSVGFERRMQRLIKKISRKSIFVFNKKVPLRKALRYAVLVVILALLTIGAGAAIYWDTFFVEEHDIYALLKTTDIEGAPTILEERYEITTDLSGFTSEIITDEEFWRTIEYRDNENVERRFEFQQSTKASYQGVRLDTENAEQGVTLVYINGYDGLYIKTQFSSHLYIWDNGDYFFSIVATETFSQDELIDIMNSVQKVER